MTYAKPPPTSIPSSGDAGGARPRPLLCRVGWHSRRCVEVLAYGGPVVYRVECRRCGQTEVSAL